MILYKYYELNVPDQGLLYVQLRYLNDRLTLIDKKFSLNDRFNFNHFLYLLLSMRLNTASSNMVLGYCNKIKCVKLNNVINCYLVLITALTCSFI